MPKRIHSDRPLTNAEKQRRFREKKKKMGIRREEIWTDGVFLAREGKAANSSDSTWAQISRKEFEKQFQTIFEDYEEYQRELIYADLIEYAKRIKPKYDKVDADVTKIAESEIKTDKSAGKEK